MAMSIWFWIIFLLAAFFGLYWNVGPGYAVFSGNLALFALLFLLGYRSFGPPIQG